MELGVLKKVVKELDEELRGGFIAKIYQPLPREIVLKVRLATFGEKRLILSADPGLGRIHTTSLKIPNPQTPPRFCAYLRAHLQGSRIESIRVPIEDRVLEIRCIRGKNEDLQRRLLTLEIIGRDSNIILVRENDGAIMECLQRIHAKDDEHRPVLPGVTYRYPSLNPKNPVKLGDEASGSDRPTIEDNDLAKPSDRLEKEAMSHTESQTSVDKALDVHYSCLLEKRILETFRRNLRTPVTVRIRSLRNRLQKINDDKNRLDGYALQQKIGELIKFNLKKIQKGMASVNLVDWETNSHLTVQLDASLSPVGNMERYFAKSSKARRGMSIVEERLRVTNEEIRALQDVEYLISEAQTIQELEQLAEEIQAIGKSKSQQSGKQDTKPQTPKTRPFIEFLSPSGLRILVGKSSGANDTILRRIAGRNDLWFHVRDFAGAHVFMVSSGSTHPTEADITYAAGLAVKNSKASSSKKAEVMVACVRDLNRPKGAFPGQVNVKNFYTVIGVSDK